MRMRVLSLIVTVGIGAAPVLPGQQPQPQPRGRQPTDLVAMQCGSVTAGRAQAAPAAQGPVRGRFGDTLRARPTGRAERPDRTMETMGSMAQFLPAVILQRQERLKLTAVQTTRLQALQTQARGDCAHHMQLAIAAQQAGNQILGAATPDLAAYAAKLKEASAHTVEAQVAMAKGAVEARKVLTAGQRQAIQSRMQARR